MIFDLFNSGGLIQNLFLGLFFSILISFISYKLKFLTKSGITALFILAIVIFGFGSWKWTIPILTFFITSSLLSKIRKKSNKKIEELSAKSSRRDYLQVLSNGGIAGLLVIFNYIYPSELLYLFFVTIIASAASDTWATEFGTAKKVETFNIITFKPVEQGLSGGVSLIGLTGALIGSIIISLTALPWLNNNQLFYLIVISFSGFTGSIIDSISGALFQSTRKCTDCGIITEKENHCGKGTINIKGISWFNNDLVNLTSGFAGGLIVLALIRFSGIK